MNSRRYPNQPRIKNEIAQVGTISLGNNDHTIGDIITEAMEKVGKEVLSPLKRQNQWRHHLK